MSGRFSDERKTEIMKENKRNILVVMISMIAAMLLFMSCKEDGDYMTCT